MLTCVGGVADWMILYLYLYSITFLWTLIAVLKVSTVFQCEWPHCGVAWVPKLTGDCGVTIASHQRPVSSDDDNNDEHDNKYDNSDFDNDSNGGDIGI